MDEILAYFAGFVASDGHIRTNRRKSFKTGLFVEHDPKSLSIHINARDVELLYEFERYLPNVTVKLFTREVDVFNGHHYITKNAELRLHNQQFVKNLSKTFDIPVGKKSAILQFPTLSPDMERHYVRGIIDGDGSLGLLKDGRPYVSLITVSSSFANSYCEFLKRITGIDKTTSPNKRDGAHNILIYSEAAQRLTTYLYQNATIALGRKRKSANEIMTWVNTSGRIETHPKRWSTDEDKIVVAKSIQEAAKLLGRSERSVKMRRWRLT